MTKIYYILPLLTLTACQTVQPSIAKNNGRHVKATWYGIGDGSGSHTANGTRFNPWSHAAAHRTLPFNTKLKITNPHNDKSVIVVVNDRGPRPKNIEIDLTKGAANAINMKGTQTVIMEKIDGR